VPMEESLPFRTAAQRHGIAPIFVCPPNADAALLREIAAHGRAYTYLLSRAGVTGSENHGHVPLEHLVKTLKEYHGAPALQGFGISEPAQVREALAAGAAGAISGSAIVKIIERNIGNPTAMLDQLSTFVREMKAATRG